MSRLRVLQSFSTPSEDDNPFIRLTIRSVENEVEVQCFTWRGALCGRYEVLHLHWLDPFVYGPTRAAALAHWAGSLLLIARLRVTRTPVVRTLHNKAIRGGGGRLVRLIVAQLESVTVLTIAMNRQSAPAVGRTVLVPHGHYRPWYDRHHVPPSVEGRLLTFGLLRAYKGLDTLLDAFTATESTRPTATLHVVGRVVDQEVGRSVEAALDRDTRLISRPGHATDAELATEIGESEIVVLPYDDLFNSGCVLLTLSLGRPVLVPECDAARELVDEFGPAWVQMFTPPLTGADLGAALDAASSENRPGIDLSRRDWSAVGAATVAAYQEAIAIRRGHGGPGGP